jgi:uncharacterized membrane protein HdeD (DUF308 family)
VVLTPRYADAWMIPRRTPSRSRFANEADARRSGSTTLTTALVLLLGIYLFIAGIFRIIAIFLDSSSWGWKLAAGILCLIAGVAILSDPLWSTTLASTWLVILVGFLAMLQGAAGLVVAFQGGGWGMGVLSVLGILFGLFLVINPLIGVATLTFILAIFMLIGGVGAVVQAFRMRRAAASVQQSRRVR